MLDFFLETDPIALLITAIITFLSLLGVWKGLKKLLLKFLNDSFVKDFADIFIQLAESMQVTAQALADDKITQEEKDKIVAEFSDVVKEIKEFFAYF